MPVFLSELLSRFGKGAGFMAFGFLQTSLAWYLLARGVDGMQIAAAFGAVAGPLYAAGAWKASAEARK